MKIQILPRNNENMGNSWLDFPKIESAFFGHCNAIIFEQEWPKMVNIEVREGKRTYKNKSK